MLPILIVVLIAFIAYTCLLVMYMRAWKSVPLFIPSGEPRTRVSILIPARNEEDNIGRLLTALTGQHYPAGLCEIIVIDDQSDDRTAAIAATYPAVRVICLSGTGLNSHKKRAIQAGVNAASGELIITTDADCLPGNEWVRTMVLFYEQHDTAFVAAPVAIRPADTALSMFQSMDFMILQGITAGSVQQQIHAMCNGANMAYRRTAFADVKGFDGIDHIASGDDMLLMYKIRKRYPDQVHYLLSPAAIMTTLPQPTLRAFIRQRIRWASKATHYQEKNLLPVLATVYLFNLLFPVVIVAALWLNPLWWLVLALWIGKTIVELPFFLSLSRFYGYRWSPFIFFCFQPFHILYTIASGFLGQFRTYEWKGRKVS